MTKRIISQSRAINQTQPLELEPNEVLQALSKYYRKPTNQVIQVLYKMGHSYSDVGKILGVSKQRVQQQYPMQKEVKA